MSRSKGKKSIYRDAFASLNDGDKYFGTIYAGMLKSPVFRSMSIGARNFYNTCRVHAQQSECKAVLYRHGEQIKKEYDSHYFVFPEKHLKEYGIDKSSACRWFKELERNGFIEVVERNSHRTEKAANIYKFSNSWKEINKRMLETG